MTTLYKIGDYLFLPKASNLPLGILNIPIVIPL